MQTGSCAAVDIVDKKNLPAGNYEEQDSFIVGDRIYQGLADAVEPVTGITNGAEKTAQSFLVNGSLELNEDENNEGLDTAVQIMVQVDAYQTLNRPVIDTRWTRVITNYAMLYLRDLSNEADGYQFVTAKSQKDLKKGNYTAQTKITNSELNQYPELKYIPAGTHSLYCRA